MDSFIEIIKNNYFYYARFVSEVIVDKDFLSEYGKLKPNQKQFFDLISLPEAVSSVPNAHQLEIMVPNFKTFKREDLEVFKPTSDLFEAKLKDPISIFGRVVLHYPTRYFYSEPMLPVVLEEKKNDFGKVILKGMRVALPEHTEFNSVTLDVQACSHCKVEDVFIDIQSSRVEKYSFGYLKNFIKKATDFSKVFIKEKAPKIDEQK